MKQFSYDQTINNFIFDIYLYVVWLIITITYSVTKLPSKYFQHMIRAVTQYYICHHTLFFTGFMVQILSQEPTSLNKLCKMLMIHFNSFEKQEAFNR